MRYKNLLKDAYKDLRDLLSSAPDECAIMYCHSKVDCNDIGARLSRDGLACRGIVSRTNMNVVPCIVYRSCSGDNFICHSTLYTGPRPMVLLENKVHTYIPMVGFCTYFGLMSVVECFSQSITED